MISIRLISKFLLCLLVVFFGGTLFGQSNLPPNHRRLLFENDLMQEYNGEKANITNRDGTFLSGKGWEISVRTAQLYIELTEPMPFEGTIEFDMIGIDPPRQVKDDWVAFSMYSRPSADFYQLNTTLASLALLKTSRSRLNGEEASFHFSSVSYRASESMYDPTSDNREETNRVGIGVWDPSHKYHFKIVYNTEYMWLYIDNALEVFHEFQGQMEKFKYILLGQDNTYYWASIGPIYSNLKIYGPEIELPFTDITLETNLMGYSDLGYGHGVSFADANQDGLIDVFSSNAVRALVVPDMLHINQGDGTFSDEAELRGIDDKGVTHAILNADFDNDGDLDVFCSNMPIDLGSSLGRNALYRNIGNGYYEDITEIGGIIKDNNASRGALALDIENDGDLDIYVVNWGESNELYVNDGNAIFTREDRGANGDIEDIDILGQQGASAVDFDNDGDVDIYVCRRQEADVNAPNWLFVNDGAGNFTDEAQARGVDFGGRSNGASFADVDNDGDLDLFVVNSIDGNHKLQKLNVAFNNGDGTFIDKTNDYNIELTGYNALFADIDNDTDLDLYLIKNDVSDEGARPEIYLNDGSGGLTKVGYSEARIPAKDPRGAAYADIDGDGDLDFYVAAKYSHNFMVRNDIENDNKYIRVLPIGPSGDYGGFGTKVTIYQPGHLGDREYIIGYQHAQSTFGYLCQNQTALHFGLASFTSCDIKLEFTNGTVRNLTDISANQVVTVPAVIPVATLIESYNFNATSGFAGQQLESPVQVRVNDSEGNPVSDHSVTFSIDGEGFINQNLKNVETTTNGNGIASVSWSLGTTAGAANEMIATSFLDEHELAGSPLSFSIMVIPGPDTLLTIHSGNNQSGGSGNQLENPLVVSVADNYGNPHAGVGVIFTVDNENGHFENETTITDFTNAEGLASVNWTLGESDLEQQTATAQLLSDASSVVTFNAKNTTGVAAELVYVSGDSAIGLAGAELATPLVIQIVNQQADPVPGYPVTFSVPDGGGHFNGASEIQVLTDENGYASAKPTLTNTYGNYTILAAALKSEEHLVGSPFQFNVKVRKSYATTLQFLTEDELIGRTSSFLNTHIIFKVEGPASEAVPGHDVIFKVIKGNGKLGNSLVDSLVVKSDDKGLAKVLYKLGDEIGTDNNQLLVSSNDGLDELMNSPFVVTASALFGSPDSLLSTVTVTDSVIADGESKAQVTVTLFDKANNPVSGEVVVVQTAGTGLVIDQPEGPSDENGQVRAFIRSGKAGTYTVSAFIPAENIHLQQFVSLTFITGPPLNLEQISGMDQSGVINSVLGYPLKVRVLDKTGNIVPDAQVVFTVLEGGGYVSPSSEILSNNEGIASANWVLGPQIGRQELEAKVKGTDGTVRFIAQAGTPGNVELTIQKGDNQIVAPGSTFADSLVVRVNDVSNSPVAGIRVAFSVSQGDVLISKTHVSSNQFGLAGIAATAGNSFGSAIIRAQIDENNFVDFAATIAETVPVKIIALENNILVGTANDTMTTLGIKVLDAESQATAGVSVTYASQSEGASILSAKTVKTDENGQAKAVVKLAKQVGTNSFTASASGLQGSPVSFFIETVADKPTKIDIESGDKQSALGGTILEEKIYAKVVDQFGNPNISSLVEFKVESGGGSIEDDSSVETNDNGLACVSWRVGDNGVQMVSATVVANPSLKTFFTAFLTQNLPPVITSVSDTTIHEQQILVFNVNVYDPEGKAVTLHVSGLPNGAYFDAANSHNFIWTPTISQAGVYPITFTASDEQNQTAQKIVQIKVLNKNRPPAIAGYLPSQSTVTVSPYQQINFSVNVVDLDSDDLSYKWYLNNELYSTEAEWGFVVASDLTNNSQVMVTVSDGSESVSRTWNLHITQTSVNLSSFRGYSSRGAVQIEWSASDEELIQGYNILRSTNKKNFNKINGELIKTNSLGCYTYQDVPEDYSPAFYYKLEQVVRSGHTSSFGLVSVQVQLPNQNKLYQNYPNPFNPTTKLEFQIVDPQEIELAIINISGQTIRTLYYGHSSPGYFTQQWDGRNDTGKIVPSGIYYCVLKGDNIHQCIKLLLLK